MAQLDWWPVDKLILAYFAAAAALEIAWWRQLPDAGLLVGLHVAASLLVLVAMRFPGSRASQVFRFWYPLPYVAACYKEMSLLIPVVRGRDYDPLMARLDLAVWGAHPSVWLERWRSPLLAEVVQMVYAGFVPVVLLVAWVLWRRRRQAEFRFYAFLIALGFLASYIGYLAVPVRGPRFLLRDLYTHELRGLWLFDWLRGTLDVIESAHYDCFPSGHTELIILAWFGSRRISALWFRSLFAYTLGVVFATVYLRYHYTVDVLAGAVLAVLLLVTAPDLYAALGGRSSSQENV